MPIFLGGFQRFDENPSGISKAQSATKDQSKFPLLTFVDSNGTSPTQSSTRWDNIGQHGSTDDSEWSAQLGSGESSWPPLHMNSSSNEKADGRDQQNIFPNSRIILKPPTERRKEKIVGDSKEHNEDSPVPPAVSMEDDNWVTFESSHEKGKFGKTEEGIDSDWPYNDAPTKTKSSNKKKIGQKNQPKNQIAKKTTMQAGTGLSKFKLAAHPNDASISMVENKVTPPDLEEQQTLSTAPSSSRDWYGGILSSESSSDESELKMDPQTIVSEETHSGAVRPGSNSDRIPRETPFYSQNHKDSIDEEEVAENHTCERSSNDSFGPPNVIVPKNSGDAGASITSELTFDHTVKIAKGRESCKNLSSVASNSAFIGPRESSDIVGETSSPNIEHACDEVVGNAIKLESSRRDDEAHPREFKTKQLVSASKEIERVSREPDSKSSQSGQHNPDDHLNDRTSTDYRDSLLLQRFMKMAAPIIKEGGIPIDQEEPIRKAATRLGISLEPEPTPQMVIDDSKSPEKISTEAKSDAEVVSSKLFQAAKRKRDVSRGVVEEKMSIKSTSDTFPTEVTSSIAVVPTDVTDSKNRSSGSKEQVNSGEDQTEDNQSSKNLPVTAEITEIQSENSIPIDSTTRTGQISCEQSELIEMGFSRAVPQNTENIDNVDKMGRYTLTNSADMEALCEDSSDESSCESIVRERNANITTTKLDPEPSGLVNTLDHEQMQPDHNEVVPNLASESTTEIQFKEETDDSGWEETFDVGFPQIVTAQDSECITDSQAIDIWNVGENDVNFQTMETNAEENDLQKNVPQKIEEKLSTSPKERKQNADFVGRKTSSIDASILNHKERQQPKPEYPCKRKLGGIGSRQKPTLPPVPEMSIVSPQTQCHSLRIRESPSEKRSMPSTDCPPTSRLQAEKCEPISATVTIPSVSSIGGPCESCSDVFDLDGDADLDVQQSSSSDATFMNLELSIPVFKDKPIGSTMEEIALLNKFLIIAGPNFNGVDLTVEERERIHDEALKSNIPENFLNRILDQSAGILRWEDSSVLSASSLLTERSNWKRRGQSSKYVANTPGGSSSIRTRNTVSTSSTFYSKRSRGTELFSTVSGMGDNPSSSLSVNTRDDTVYDGGIHAPPPSVVAAAGGWTCMFNSQKNFWSDLQSQVINTVGAAVVGGDADSIIGGQSDTAGGGAPDDISWTTVGVKSTATSTVNNNKPTPNVVGI